jgi:hypothetical protein
MNWATDFTLFIRFNSRWLIDLNVKHKTIKLLDNIWENLDGLSYGYDFRYNTKHKPWQEQLTNLKIKAFILKRYQANKKISHSLGENTWGRYI